jgi:rhodanese-related sulfurtransferase
MNLKNTLFRTLHKDARKGARILPKEAHDAVRSGRAVLVDVREADELADGGCAEGAHWLPTSEIEADSPAARDFVAKLPKEKVIIVYCGAGVRSGRFIERLEREGFQAANLGGFDDWAAAGLPVSQRPRTL